MFYLKYRSQTFSELDNSVIRESLGRAVLANKWSHAYLLVGPKGTGKTSVARLIAKTVNCTKRKEGQEPCNECASCISITQGSSLDVVEIDAASNTGVDDIRTLRERAKLAPAVLTYKVYIIDEVHMLSNSAFNALLKILEEPPKHVIFVLATTEMAKLPRTIVSRCLVYDFGKHPKSDVVTSLRRVAVGEKLKVTDEALSQIAVVAGGSFRDAQKLLEQLSMESDNLDLEHINMLFSSSGAVAAAHEILQALEGGEKEQAVVLVENFTDSDGKIKDLTDALISELRDILLFRNGVSEDIKDSKISSEAIDLLIRKLIDASNLARDCPVQQLPLEMVIIEYFAGSQLPVLSSALPASPKSQRGESDSSSSVVGSSETEEPMTVEPEAENREQKTDSTGIVAKWPEILAKLKDFNHSLVAFLRASRPGQMEGDTLTVEVFYRFHKEKLEEKKNRDILEEVISDIIGSTIKVKFILAEKKNG